MVLPEGLEFGKPGWWLAHLLFVLLVYMYGYRKGREDERKSQRRGPEDPPDGGAASPGPAGPS